VKAVIDSSVLFSALLKHSKPAGRVVILAADAHYSAVVSEKILKETRKALFKKVDSFTYSEQDVAEFMESLGEIFEVVSDLPPIEPICRDPDDDHILAAALAAGADLIVTGDKDLLVLNEYRGIRIVTVRAFLDMLDESSA
jgi:putative PIN family toxin of toxin-antitoxin system